MTFSQPQFLFLFLFPLFCLAQEVEVHNFQYRDIVNKERRLDYLEDLKDTSDLTYIAELRMKAGDLYKLYYQMHQKSTLLGAEIYRLKNFSHDSTSGIYAVSWNIYHCTDSVRDMIRKKAYKDVAYIFSSPEEGAVFRLNNMKYSIPPRHYLKIDLDPADEWKLNKGGLFGTTQWISSTEDGVNQYIYFGGADFTPVAGLNYVGVSIKTGTILQHDIPIGVFLSKVFKQYNEEEEAFKIQDLRE